MAAALQAFEEFESSPKHEYHHKHHCNIAHQKFQIIFLLTTLACRQKQHSGAWSSQPTPSFCSHLIKKDPFHQSTSHFFFFSNSLFKGLFCMQWCMWEFLLFRWEYIPRALLFLHLFLGFSFFSFLVSFLGEGQRSTSSLWDGIHVSASYCVF